MLKFLLLGMVTGIVLIATCEKIASATGKN